MSDMKRREFITLLCGAVAARPMELCGRLGDEVDQAAWCRVRYNPRKFSRDDLFCSSGQGLRLPMESLG